MKPCGETIKTMINESGVDYTPETGDETYDETINEQLNTPYYTDPVKISRRADAEETAKVCGIVAEAKADPSRRVRVTIEGSARDVNSVMQRKRPRRVIYLSDYERVIWVTQGILMMACLAKTMGWL